MNRDQSDRPVYILLAGIVIDLIGFGVAIPVLPDLAKSPHASGCVLGSILATYAAMQVVFAPTWGGFRSPSAGVR